MDWARWRFLPLPRAFSTSMAVVCNRRLRLDISLCRASCRMFGDAGVKLRKLNAHLRPVARKTAQEPAKTLEQGRVRPWGRGGSLPSRASPGSQCPNPPQTMPLFSSRCRSGSWLSTVMLTNHISATWKIVEDRILPAKRNGFV